MANLPARIPEQLAPLLRAAEALDRAGKRAEAIDAYQEIVVGRPPQSLPSLSRLVDLLEADGRKDEALRVVMDAAAVWQETGFVIQSRVMWTRACRMAPGDPAPLLGLARAPLSHRTRPMLKDRALLQEGYERLVAAGRHADAAALKAAVAFGPEDVVEHGMQLRLQEVATMAENGRHDEAIALADRIGAETDRPDVRDRLREIYEKCRDWTRAAATSRAIARTLREQGRVAEASVEEARADALDPTRPEIWMRTARREIREGRPAGALAALERGIPLARGVALADAWEMVALAAALNDDGARLRDAAAAMARVDPARLPAFHAMHPDPGRGGHEARRLHVPEGVAGLEMRPRLVPRSWVVIRPGTDGTLRLPPGWELKVRLGGLEEEPGAPADLAGWPADAVAELDLSFTRIGDADLVPVARFTRLRRLSLDCVDMAWGLVPMASKIGLKVANLFDDSRGRGVTSAGVVHLAGLKELRHLDLGTTGIDDAALPNLSRLAKVAILMLNRTGVEGRGLRALADAGIPLRELGLSRSRLTLDAIEILAGFGQLEVLHLDGLIVDSARFASLRHLPLHTLTASMSTVDAPDLVHLAGLRRLDLTATSAGDGDVKALATLQRLAVLGIRDTAIGDAGLLELARIPSLRRVYAGAKQFSGDAIARATAVNPELVVDATGQALELHLDEG